MAGFFGCFGRNSGTAVALSVLGFFDSGRPGAAGELADRIPPSDGLPFRLELGTSPPCPLLRGVRTMSSTFAFAPSVLPVLAAPVFAAGGARVLT